MRSQEITKRGGEVQLTKRKKQVKYKSTLAWVVLGCMIIKSATIAVKINFLFLFSMILYILYIYLLRELSIVKFFIIITFPWNSQPASKFQEPNSVVTYDNLRQISHIVFSVF